jgi:adenylate cyclase
MAIAGGLVFLAVLGLRGTGALEPLELAAYDWHIRLRAPSAAPSPILLVTLTEQDIQKLGTWPLPDALLARGLDRLAKSGARAIGVDIYRDVPVLPGHEALEAVLKAHDRIVAAMLLPRGSQPGVRPPAALAGSDRVGFTDLVVDPDGRVRRGLLLMDDGKDVYFSLPLRLALLYLADAGVSAQGDPQDPTQLRLGHATVRPFEANDGGYVRADAGGYQFLLDYREPPDAFATLSFTRLLAGDFDAALVRDRIVIVGVTADSVKDSFYTPYSGAFGARETTYGVALYGHIVSQLVRAGLAGDTPPAVMNDLGEAGWILLWCLLGAAAAFGLRNAWRFYLALAAGLLVLAAAVHAMFLAGWWIPLVPPALGGVAAAGAGAVFVSSREKRERARLMSLFSKYVSPELAEAIWREREQFLSGGRPRPQRLTATVLFSDVGNFTTISEALDPPVLMGWLYDFMEATTPLVSSHGGVIFRFIGDSIMAVFGVPVARRGDAEIARDAANAVDCALAMQERVIALNASLAARGLPLIGMRIGILTGPMVAGSLGSASRMEYNVHGDTVNTAARLESFERERFAPDYHAAPCRILVGEPTLRLLGEAFHTEYLGEFHLKGKAKPMRIHRVLGRNGSAALRAGRDVAAA